MSTFRCYRNMYICTLSVISRLLLLTGSRSTHAQHFFFFESISWKVHPLRKETNNDASWTAPSFTVQVQQSRFSLLSGKANGSLLSYIQLWKIVTTCWQEPVLSIITPTTNMYSLMSVSHWNVFFILLGCSQHPPAVRFQQRHNSSDYIFVRELLSGIWESHHEIYPREKPLGLISYFP
jgi:hypothetical protein